ncbi:hypothetical protein BDV09DRAFT_94976 [Aspergillus tetrazonus]
MLVKRREDSTGRHKATVEIDWTMLRRIQLRSVIRNCLSRLSHLPRFMQVPAVPPSNPEPRLRTLLESSGTCVRVAM